VHSPCVHHPCTAPSHSQPTPITYTPTYTAYTPTTASTTAPVPRGIVPRPRPMSLPPQAYTPAHSGTSSDRTRQYVEQPHATPPKHSQRSADTAKPRTTNRILGDYTLSKTLGAGSMGKVKLAHHNLTGEKVCDLSLSSVPTFHACLFIRYVRIITFSTSIAASSPT
jgi:hypothetical protein